MLEVTTTGELKEGSPNSGNTLLYEALKSPALHSKGEGYPKAWGGRVPLKIRMNEQVKSDPFCFLIGEAEMIAEDGALYYCWVNKYGAVAAILPNAKHLGVKPNEFEVEEWH